MASAIETNNQVRFERGNLIFSNDIRGIEINKPLSLEMLFFWMIFWVTGLPDVDLSFLERASKMKKPLSLSSFVTFAAVGTWWIPRQGWSTGERKGWNGLKQVLHESLGLGVVLEALNDNTKILTDTNTETFFPIANFPKPRLFSKTKVFQNRNRDFFPKPRLFFETKFFWNRNQDFFFRNRNPQRFGKSFETEKFWNQNVTLWCCVVFLFVFLPQRLIFAGSFGNYLTTKFQAGGPSGLLNFLLC